MRSGLLEKQTIRKKVILGRDRQEQDGACLNVDGIVVEHKPQRHNEGDVTVTASPGCDDS
jgi:hypothetical protein